MNPITSDRIDPYEVAYLRGGRNELARVVMISLVERRYLELYTPDRGVLRSFTGRTKYIRQRAPRLQPTLSQIEQTVYGWFSEPRSAAEVFRRTFPDQLNTYCLQFEERLQRKRLLRDEGSSGVLGFLRRRTGRRVTLEGRDYVHRLRHQPVPAAQPYTFAAAVAGAAALTATPLSDLGAEFKKSQRQDASSCGGWGGWSGGCGGGSCSSGCGGGGSCGGGSGGCGGGGCGGS